MKKFLLSMAAIAMTMSMANAAELTYNVDNATDFQGTLVEETYKDDGSVQAAKHYQPLESMKLGDFTFTFTTGEGTSDPAYYWATSTNQNQQRTLRVYKKNTMTVAAPAGTEMTQISFTLNKSTSKGSMTVNTGEFTKESNTVMTWTGSAAAVTFTIGPDDNLQIKEVTFTTGSSTMETVAMPTFTPASGTSFADQLSVSIAAEEGADIYYTLDGTNPTTDSDKYEAPIILTATTTVKAFAVKAGMNDSPVATAVYTKDVAIESLLELIVEGLDDEETEFTYTGEAVVTYVNGSNMYIHDETASLLVYGKLNRTYEQGDVLTGFKGTFKNYYSTYELMANASSFGEPVKTMEVEPVEYTIATITPMDQNDYIILKEVTFDPEAMTLKQGDDEIGMYDKFKVEVPTTTGVFNVVGIISYYTNKGDTEATLQVYPISFEIYDPEVSVKGIEADAMVRVEGGNIIAPADAQVYSVSGARVNANGLQGGIYLVRTADKVYKVIVK